MALHGGLSFYKTQQVVGFDCAGIERLSVPQPITLVSYHLTGRARIGIVMPRGGATAYGSSFVCLLLCRGAEPQHTVVRLSFRLLHQFCSAR